MAEEKKSKPKEQKQEKKKETKKATVDQLLLKSFRRYARAAGFKIQPDKKLLDFVIKGELSMLKKYGELYCPCRRVTGDKQADKKNICPCVFHKYEIRDDGHCKCQLYFKK